MSINKFSISLILFLAVTISLPWHQGSFQAMAQAGSEKKVVLIDEGHGQYFNSTNLSKAIAAIENTGKAVVHTTTRALADEVLAGVDLLLVTYPSSNVQTVFTQSEKKAVADWIKTGKKSLFLLTNPYDSDSNLKGNPLPLNSLITSAYLNVENSGFYVDTTTVLGPDVIVNGTEPEKSQASRELLQLEVKSAALQLINSSHDSLSLLARSSSLIAQHKIVLTGFNTYSTIQGGIPVPGKENLCILGIAGLGDNSKLALAGSALMFSDLTGPEDKSWFETQNNSVLFTELVNWLLNIIPVTQSGFQNWAIAIPLVIGLVGITAMLIGPVFSRKSATISAERSQESLIDVTTDPSSAEKTTQASGAGHFKRERKFAQRRETAQQNSTQKRK